MPHDKHRKDCSKFLGLPKITQGCEQSRLKICLDTCSPEGKIRWYKSSDGKHWSKICGQKKSCLKFVPSLEDNGKFIRAKIQDSCECWISRKTQLQILPSASLIIDNGVVGNTIGNNPCCPPPEQFLWLNRLTPSSYPFILEEVRVYFASESPADRCDGPTGVTGIPGPTSLSIGDPIDIYIWANPGGYFNPAAGHVLQKSLTNQKIKKLDEFSSYTLNESVIFEEGDVLIGVVNRIKTSPYFPAALQIACVGSAKRSWIGQGYKNGIVPNPPFLPAPDWSLIDDVTSGNLFAGNWLIRAIGCGGSQSLEEVIPKYKEKPNNHVRGF